MIRARQEGRSEEEVIAESKIAHERDFAGFDMLPAGTTVMRSATPTRNRLLP